MKKPYFSSLFEWKFQKTEFCIFLFLNTHTYSVTIGFVLLKYIKAVFIKPKIVQAYSSEIVKGVNKIKNHNIWKKYKKWKSVIIIYLHIKGPGM